MSSFRSKNKDLQRREILTDFKKCNGSAGIVIYFPHELESFEASIKI